jgi:hypothetical protein
VNAEDFKNDIKSALNYIEDKVAGVSGDVDTDIAKIKANPETTEVLNTLISVASAELPAGVVSAAGKIFAELLTFFAAHGAPAPAAAPDAVETPTTEAPEEPMTGSQLMGLGR